MTINYSAKLNTLWETFKLVSAQSFSEKRRKINVFMEFAAESNIKK